MGATDVDLGCTEINADPDGWSRERLAEGSVQRSERNRAWLLLSYKAATDGFLDPRLSADRTPAFRRALARRGPAFERTYELLSGWMVFRDPPTHTRLREPVRRAFTPRVVEGLRDAIESTVAELLDGFGPGEHIDLKERFAGPLPALVIADLLGVPRSDRPRFQAWSDRLADVVFSVDGAAVDEAAIVAATEEFIAFFGELIRQRTARPGDDLISKVVSISHDELSALEVVGACTLLLFAGHETTTNLIASSVRTLFGHPGEIARLVAGEVDATAADELLRMCGPAKSMARKVAEAHERGGHHLAVGDTVFCVILSANRDPAAFPEPDRLDLGRDPNPHLGFGWGMHLCLGANLARLEALIALRRLYERFPRLSPDGELPAWHGNPLGRSIREMPVVL